MLYSTLLLLLIASNLNVVHSQSWAGIYTTETACDITSCCCLTGEVVLASTSANTYTVNSSMSGSDCNGITTYSGYLHTSGYEGWMILFSTNTSVELNIDSSSVTVTNWDDPFCSVLGVKNGIAKLDIDTLNLLVVASIGMVMSITKF
ncbi:unnamed protein product [Adineta steineri]|uniref:Uncharacterized protein n=1 Tax=Adineta steineri TaxID=433720 RepID=A0A815V7W5_9BILA|nr:unnamed protein product [Adineta steineri]CAF4027105.1 unnamed protein product [Adineta steineri]